MKRKVSETISVDHDSKEYIGFWANYITNKGELSYDTFLNVKEKPTDVSIDDFISLFEQGKLDAGSNFGQDDIIALIHKKGVLRVQKELNIDEPTYDPEIALKVIQKAWNHDYIGQYNDSYGFYIQNLAEILKIEEMECYGVFAKLEEKEQAGLNGAIIIPFEKQEEAFKMLEEQTGHKKLDRSDFGTWYCAHCGKFGDERTNPKDYSCK